MKQVANYHRTRTYVDETCWAMHKQRYARWAGTLKEYCQMNAISECTVRRIIRAETFAEYKAHIKAIFEKKGQVDVKPADVTSAVDGAIDYDRLFDVIKRAMMEALKG